MNSHSYASEYFEASTFYPRGILEPDGSTINAFKQFARTGHRLSRFTRGDGLTNAWYAGLPEMSSVIIEDGQMIKARYGWLRPDGKERGKWLSIMEVSGTRISERQQDLRLR